MGIPSYFSWLVKHFEDDIIYDNNPYENTHQLYLDYNGGIHPAARNKPESSIPEMINYILIYLEYLIDTVNPSELIFIAIDGGAPAAKMKQQRSRRFKTIKEIKELNQIKKDYNIKIEEKKQKDFNMISPGTEFMSIISKEIVYFLEKHKKGKYKHLKIIFTDSSVPGEGEHKILAYIRQQTLNKNCAIYGLDSDLIMLALSTNRNNLTLVRENTLIKDNDFDFETDKFPKLSYFIIDNLRNHIVNIMNPYTSLMELEGLKIFSVKDNNNNSLKINDNCNINFLYEKMKSKKFFNEESDTIKLVRDYIFISFLLGNDFVPSFESLKIREGGIEQIVRAYKKVIQNKCQYLLDDDLKINEEFFYELILLLSEIETHLLKKQKKSRDYRIKSKNSTYKPSDYMEAIQEYQSVDGLYNDIINVFNDGWEKRYYEYFFHIKKTESYNRESQIETICEDYIKALHWISKYYFDKCPDWYWYYQHEATPLLNDFAKYIISNPKKICSVNFTMHQPIQPLYQLLIILPPQSSKLLPKTLRKIMKNDESPFIHYYPIDFGFEYYGKRFKWECHPKVPMINPSELLENLIYIEDQLTDSEKQLNKFGIPFEF